MNFFSPGFNSPMESQSCFRGVLQALSRPGTMVTLEGILTPPPPLSPAAAAILLTLADPFTAVSLPESEAAREWLTFHAKARLTSPEAADFVLTFTRPALAGLRQGTDDEPEDSATLILDCPSFDLGRHYRLTGPGIETETLVQLPLDENFVAEWRAQSGTAPRGVDVILCAGTNIIGLPRSLTIEEV
jgi:alpha-D-ribose 1-methylphosphonate 5-triphosphate synthase subunit PhnH